MDAEPRASGVAGHLDGLVADLAAGRLAGADPALVLNHLDRCADCRSELADAVVAAAALRELPAVDPAPEPVPPAAAAAGAPHDRRGNPAGGYPAAGLPAGGYPAAGLPAAGHPAGRRRRGALVGAGLVLALAVGAAGGGVAERLARDGSPSAAAPTPASTLAPTPAPTPASTPVRTPGPTGTAGTPAASAGPGVAVQAVLAAADGQARSVGVVVVGGSGANRRMSLWTSGLSAPGAGEVYEVWLDGTTPLAVGFLDGAGTGSWVMPSTAAAGRPTLLLVRQLRGAAAPAAGQLVARASLS